MFLFPLLPIASAAIFSDSDVEEWKKTTITGLSWEDFQSHDCFFKQKRLYQYVLDTAYSGSLPTEKLSPFKTISELSNPIYLSKTYIWNSDELPPDRGGVKDAHRWGTVGTADWIVHPESTYTGFLGRESGTHPLVVRFSQAKPGVNKPGIALKFLISGRESENIVAMHSVAEATSYFFRSELTTAIPVPRFFDFEARVVAYWFRKSLNYLKEGFPADEVPLNERIIPLQRLSRIRSDGTFVSEARAPFNLIFKPTQEVKDAVDAKDNGDFRLVLAKIPSGTSLYEVFGCQSLCTASNDSSATRVATLVLTNQFVSSKYGDSVLAFKHPLAMPKKSD